MPIQPTRPKLFVSTGCSSSDVLVAPLLRELKRRMAVGSIVGVGGEPLRELGAELIYDSTPLSMIGTSGIGSVLQSGRQLLKAMGDVDKYFRTDKPDLAILVDNAGINFRFQRLASELGVPVLYYVPPELWSVWWFQRSSLLRGNPKIAAIFPTQAEEYQDIGMDVDYIGHPMLDLVDTLPQAPKVVSDRPVVGLFPGSRRHELKSLLGPIRGAAERIHQAMPNCRFVICSANPMSHQMIEKELEKWTVPVELWHRKSHTLLTECHVALACSGTVTLEAALLGVPHVVMYQLTSILDSVLQKIFLPTNKYKFFSLPNVLSQRAIVPELYKSALQPERIADECLSLLQNEHRRNTMIEDLNQVRAVLGPSGAVSRAADIVEYMLEHNRPGDVRSKDPKAA